MDKKTEEPAKLTRRGIASGSAALVAIAAGALAGRASGQPLSATKKRTAVVRTSNGPVRGYIDRDIQAFKGVRYGAPTGGANRFLPPQRPAPWTDPADTIEFGAGSPQGSLGPALPTGQGTKMAEIFPGTAAVDHTGEDCLFLNVWTPAVGDGRKRPVMVWLHGGGYAIGWGASPVYEGVNLATQGDVVVITVNHRLDAVGYTQLGHVLGPRYQSSGEAGMLDIVAALEWVRDNAAEFGGDAGNVTIFGESGGGLKVSILLAMPSAKGLFHRAIIQSGAGVKMVERADGEALALALLDELSIPHDRANRILQVTTADLLLAARRAPSRVTRTGGGRLGFAPVVDGVALPRHPFDPAGPEISANVPIMIGTTQTEASLFLITDPEYGTMTWEGVQKRLEATLKERARPALELYRKLYPKASPTDVLVDINTQSSAVNSTILLAERKLAQKAAPIWVYRLDWRTPVLGGALRSPHALDLPLVFDTLESSPTLLGPGPEPKIVSRQMSATWLAFARNGNPNNAAIPHWPAYSSTSRDVMSFDVRSQVLRDPDREARQFWAQA